MIRRLALRALVALALLGGAAPARAQDALPAAEAPAAQVDGAAGAEETLPRSMRPYWHVFASFGLAWLLILGYSVSLGRRYARLEETVERMGRDG